MALSPVNPCVQSFLSQAVEAQPPSARGHASVEELDGAAYSMQHDRGTASTCTVSVRVPGASKEACLGVAADAALLGVASRADAPQDGFALTLRVRPARGLCESRQRRRRLSCAPQVDLPALRALGKQQRQDAIRALACLRLTLTGWELRCAAVETAPSRSARNAHGGAASGSSSRRCKDTPWAQPPWRWQCVRAGPSSPAARRLCSLQSFLSTPAAPLTATSSSRHSPRCVQQTRLVRRPVQAPFQPEAAAGVHGGAESPWHVRRATVHNDVPRGAGS